MKDEKFWFSDPKQHRKDRRAINKRMRDKRFQNDWDESEEELVKNWNKHWSEE